MSKPLVAQLKLTRRSYGLAGLALVLLVGLDWTGLGGAGLAARPAGIAASSAFTQLTGAANPFNGDGDPDIVLGAFDGTLWTYRNDLMPQARNLIYRTGAASPTDALDVGDYSTPVLGDLDGDGDLDLVTGENNGNVLYYRNTGTAMVPAFAQQTGAANPFNGINLGMHTAPALGDVDGDGDLDLILGALFNGLRYYQNTGTRLAPTFVLQTSPITGLASNNSYTSPALADLDGDGDLDLTVGHVDGILRYFRNTGTATAPVYTEQTTAPGYLFTGFDVGQLARPAFGDIDGDGDLDLVVGSYDSGAIGNFYYQNTGTATAPVYTQQPNVAGQFFNGIGFLFTLSPALADTDADGDVDLILGQVDGRLFYCEANRSPVLDKSIPNQTFSGPGTQSYIVPADSFLDCDRDTLTYSAKLTNGNPLPAWLSFSAATRTFSGNPGPADTTPLQILVTAADGDGRTASDDFQLTLSAVNDAPEITQGASASVTMSEDGSPTPFVLTLNATDADGNTISWSILTPATNGIATASGTGTAKAIGYTPNPNFNGPDSFAVQILDGNGGSDSITVNVTVQPVNDPPTGVSGGGPYSVSEGEALTLSAPTPTEPDGDSLSYSWDINGDGTFGDAAGQNPTLSWTQLNALGINDGLSTRNVKVRVSDNVSPAVDSVATTLTINNTAPTLTLSGLASVPVGQTYTLNLSANDPGQDTITSWTINWGDGSLPQIVSGNPSTVTHSYTAANTFTISATGTDEDGTYAADNTVSVTVACTNNPVVTNSNDSGAGSLREAIATACPGSTITFAPQVTGTIALISGQLAISKNLWIQGPGAKVLTVSGNNASRVFALLNEAVASISGLTITRANASGISVEESTLTVIGCTISNNTGLAGAGIHNSNGTLTVINSTISGNTAEGNGGGIFNSGGSTTVINSTISHNTANNSAGGGITSGGALTIINSTLYGNTASREGGGIMRENGLTTITNTIIAGSTGGDIGGFPPISGNNNLVQDGSGGIPHTITGNPLLGPLADNGGPTPTYALLPGSPAIDKGAAAADPATGNPLTTDQRGNARPFDNAGIPNAESGNGSDIGAFEAHYALTVAGGTPQSATINAAFANVLTVTLTESGNAVSGAQITFTAPGSGASVAFPNGNTAMTNASGRASVSVAANGITGSYQATAAVPGVTGVNFNLTNLCSVLSAPQIQPVNPTCNGAANGKLTIQAAGGVAPLQYSIDNGQSFGSENSFTGLSAGIYRVIIRDANGCASAAVPVTLTQPAALTLTPVSVSAAVAGTLFTQNFTAGGGTGNKTLTLDGALPEWLSFNAQMGMLSGTPPQTGSVSFSLTVRDQNDCPLTRQYVLNIGCPTITLTPQSLPSGMLYTNYSQPINAAPAGGAYSFMVSSGALPGGLMLNASTGEVSGTPTATGTFNFTIKATGFGNCTGTRSYSIRVQCPAITLDPASLPGGSLGSSYSQSVSAAPAGSYNYTLQSGTLPGGLSLNPSTGEIAGTPTSTGTFNFIIKAASGTCSGSRSYTIAIACPAIVFTRTSLSAGELGTVYSQALAVTPSGIYSSSLISGSLPGGLTLNATSGEISGTPTVAGTFTFTVKAQRAGGCSGTQQYTLVINCPTITVNPETLPAARRGIFYSQTISATPGGGSYNYAVTGGALPPGLNLNTMTGVLSGTPTVNGTSTFTVRATRAGSICAGSRSYTVIVNNTGITAAIVNDYDGDGRSDFIIRNEEEKDWLIIRSSDDQIEKVRWEDRYDPADDQLVAGDYDGDGKYDFALYRHSTGEWLIKRSRDGKVITEHLNGGAPVPADYDGDGRTDLAVWESASGKWTIKHSRDGVEENVYWGSDGDLPVAADYDGDGKADLAVYRAMNHRWQIRQSSDGLIIDREYGAIGDQPLAADYDGDGKTDLTIWRAVEGRWHILSSVDGRERDESNGVGVPILGDYDGDGRIDLAIRQGTERAWRVKLSGAREVARPAPELEVRIPERKLQK